MPKFEVKRADDVGSAGPEDTITPANDNDRVADAASNMSPEEIALTIQDQEAHQDAHKNLYLYEEDMKQMPRVSTFLKSVLSYQAVLPSQKEVEEQKTHHQSRAKLGVLLGVYLPTIQHIFGVLMFVRLAWIVGVSGTLQAFFMVFFCCLTTFVTAISMSAIATNGVVQAGGSYYMISRNLGPECGGAVGICFYLANTFAVDLYILGAIEIFLQYMAPGLAYFGDIHHNPWNNFRLYGTVTLLVLTLLVAVGVKFVQMFAPFSLMCVIISILAIFIGSFVANASNTNVWICKLGERLIALPENASVTEDATWCTKNESSHIFNYYCNSTTECDPYFFDNELEWIPGIPGIASGVIKDNLWPFYLEKDEMTPGVKIPEVDKHDHHAKQPIEVYADITSSFVVVAAIYFPSVTGIMTGSNMSGDLKDPQKSIPIGTILAQLTCTFVYLSFVLLFGTTTESLLLRDKYGQSLGGSLLASKLAWPHHWVVLVGAFCSTLGAALQCLTSAPRLLQAIARDNIIPFLGWFKVTTKNGEPIRALLITAVIAEIGIIIASIDYVAPVIDVFFLMCYGFINLTVALQTLLKSPSWRPRFKYYHWTLSVLGVLLNLTLSFIAGWYFALSAFAIAAFIYKYVEYKGGEKEWGDGIQGLSMSAAQNALLRLDEGDPHTKNWRPQLLVLCKLTPDMKVKYRRIFNLASQLKAGKGLTVFAAVIEGNYSEMAAQAVEAKDDLSGTSDCPVELNTSSQVDQMLKDIMKEEKVKGFTKVMVTKDVTEGLNIYVQTIGLGGLRHNTVMVGWPYGWKTSRDERSWKVFIDTVRSVTAKELAMLVPRNINNFPHNKERLSGTIDIWWIVHDGGMLILISFLLKQHKVWKNCKLRIFTVAQIKDNSIQLKKDLQTFLYQLRIDAEVHVEEMYDNDISAYTVERTLDMEKRTKMLQELRMKKRRNTIQEIVDASHQPQTQSRPSLSESMLNSVPTFTISEPESPSRFEFEDPEDEREAMGPTSENAMGGPTSENGLGTKDKDKQDEKPPKEKKSVTLLTDDDTDEEKMVHFTFTPSTGRAIQTIPKPENVKDAVKVPEARLMRMHTAVKLNECIVNRSKDAELVILNFPAPPSKLAAEENYMEYLEALTDNIKRVIMVRGSGMEVVTIYS